MAHDGELLPSTISANPDLVDIDLSERTVLAEVHSHEPRDVLPVDLASDSHSMSR